jgi:hypothetical protein
VESKKELKFFNIKIIYFYLISIFLIGIGYISILPPFEGFDETAHYSRLRETKDHPLAVIKKESFIDRAVVEYKGPMPFSSGKPPFDEGFNYQKFFSDKANSRDYIKNYWQTPMNSSYIASSDKNHQYQHPPLYYLLLAPLTIKSIPFIYQFYMIRAVSLVMAIAGVFFGLLALRNIFQSNGHKTELMASLFGFFIYPIIFPMFFLEFARIGNDSLCLLILGLISYIWTLNADFLCSRNKAFLIGCLLGLGLLTKALFIPITGAFLFFITLQSFANGINFSISFKLLKKLSLILFPTAIIGGSWYLFKIVTHGDPGLGTEVIELGSNGGFFSGLISNFSLIGFIRGLLVPIFSFIWAGSWSLVRMSEYLELPLVFFGFGLLYFHFQHLRKESIENYHWLGFLMFLFVYIGLAVHVLISMSLTGLGQSGGWYLHILMPWIASAIGLASFRFIQSQFKRLIFFVLLTYSFVFQLMAILSHLALFSGFASKGLNKYFLFPEKTFGLSDYFTMLNNLSVLTFPYIGILFMTLGFSILLFIIIKAMIFYKI